MARQTSSSRSTSGRESSGRSASGRSASGRGTTAKAAAGAASKASAASAKSKAAAKAAPARKTATPAKAAPVKAAPAKAVPTKAATLTIAPVTARPAARRSTSAPTAKRNEDKNVAPSQWGRRMARLVGNKFGVQMSENYSKNEGIYKRKDIVIKCAKSTMPPVSVLVDMLERIDQMWAVYVMNDGAAEVWAIDAEKVKEHGYFTHGPNVAKRVEIHLRKISKIGKLVGTLTEDEVEECRIP